MIGARKFGGRMMDAETKLISVSHTNCDNRLQFGVAGVHVPLR